MARCALAIIVFLTMARAAGAALAPEVQRWSSLADPLFQHVSGENNLPHRVATALAQDGEGFLWVGTQNGMARWDGYRFRPYQPNSHVANSLPDNYIQTLHVDSRGRLWVGTRVGGLARYDPRQDHFERIPIGAAGTSDASINAITDDGHGGIWVASMGGLDHVLSDGHTVIQLRHKDEDAGSLPENRVSALKRARNGTLWVGTRAGLAYQSSTGGAFIRVNLPIPPEGAQGISRLEESGNGRIWVGTSSHGVYVVDPPSAEHGKVQVSADATGGFGMSGDIINTIHEASPGQVWIGTTRGILAVDSTTLQSTWLWHEAGVPAGLASNVVRAILRDRSGLVWVGTSRGLGFHDPAQSAILTLFGGPNRPNKINGSDVFSVLPMPDASVWLGLRGEGINIIDPGATRVSWRRTYAGQVKAGLPSEMVWAYAGPANGAVYVASNRGIYRTDTSGKHARRLNFPPMDPSRAIRALQLDGTKMWVGGEDGLWVVDTQGASARRPQGAELLEKEYVRAMERDSAGRLWIGTRSNGLYRYDPLSHELLHMRPDADNPAALAPGTIATILLDSRGWLWVGSQGGGVNLLKTPNEKNPGRFVRLGTADGLPSNLVNKLLEDGQGKVWGSTDGGLASIAPASLRIASFGRAEGAAILNYWINSGARTKQGELLFGGSDGLTVVRPALIKRWRYAAPVVVTSIKVGDELVAAGRFNRTAASAELLMVQPEGNSISVEFSALDFSAPERNRYAYRLDGYDKDWITTDPSRRLAAYTNLAPGDYSLRLRGSNRNGEWTEPGRELKIRVLPSWQQSWWFRLAQLLVALGIVTVVVQWRTRYLRRRQFELQSQVRKHTAVLRNQKIELVDANSALNEANAKLELSVATLRQMGDIGRDITAHLDDALVFESIYLHVIDMLDAPVFKIYRVNSVSEQLDMVFGREHGKTLASASIAFDSVNAHAMRAVRGREEYLLELDAQSAHNETSDGPPMLTALFTPWIVGEKVLGVMSVQSDQEHAYGERERLIFRTICAYGAIALDNAEAYRQVETALLAYGAIALDNAEAYRQVETTLLALRATQAQLVQQAKIASIGTLTAGMAHEINNPANFIYAGSFNLSQQLSKFHQFLIELAGPAADAAVLQSLQRRFDELGDTMNTISDGAIRIRDLVRDLRTFSRLGEADLKEAAIGDSLNATINLVRMQYAQQVEIKFQLEANPVLLCWPAQLNQVFMNLIVNACQAIVARPEQRSVREPGCLTIRNSISGDYLVLEFEDNGVGMTTESIQHIFDPFYTTKATGEGMGLGLSIVIGIIEKHHGRIEVRSVVGQGSCFTLQLPLHGVESQAAKPQHQRRVQGVGDGKIAE